MALKKEFSVSVLRQVQLKMSYIFITTFVVFIKNKITKPKAPYCEHSCNLN